MLTEWRTVLIMGDIHLKKSMKFKTSEKIKTLSQLTLFFKYIRKIFYQKIVKVHQN